MIRMRNAECGMRNVMLFVAWMFVVLAIFGAWRPALGATTTNLGLCKLVRGMPDPDLCVNSALDGLDSAFSGTTEILPRLKSYTTSGLPAAGTAGRLARMTDGLQGIYLDTGSSWERLGGKVSDLLVRGCGAVSDATSCVQAAVTAAGANGVVLVPTGRSFKITSTINVTGIGIAFIGTGGFAQGANFDCQTNGTPCFDHVGAGYVTYRGITITGLTTEGAPSTTVSSGLNNTTNPVTFTVASDSGFPAATFYIKVQDEILKVTTHSGTSWTANRGQFGTTNAAHTDGAAAAQWRAPNIGILMARPLGGASCGPFHMRDNHITGYFTVAAAYNYGCEANRWDGNHITTQVDTARAYYHSRTNEEGISSAFTTIASGAVSNTHGTFTGGGLNNYSSTCTQSESIYIEGSGDLVFENMGIYGCGTRVVKLGVSAARIVFRHVVQEPTGGGTPAHFVESTLSSGVMYGLITENVATTTTGDAYYAANAGFTDCRIIQPYVGGGGGARLIQALGLIGCVIEYPVAYGGTTADLVKTTGTTQNNVFLAGKADDWTNLYAGGSRNNTVQRLKDFTFGYLELGSWPNTETTAFIGNKALDHSQAGNFAVWQNTEGRTRVNAASGYDLVLQNNGASKLYVTGSGTAIGSSGTATDTLRWAATASVADGGTITHGAGGTPTACLATPSRGGEMASVTALSSTTFTVALKKHDGTAGTTQTVYWVCFR